jgi:hypothetical protein
MMSFRRNEVTEKSIKSKKIFSPDFVLFEMTNNY